MAQQQLVADHEDLLPGPDTDQFGGDFRDDGCHLSEKGLDAVAQAWLDCIMTHWQPGRDERRRNTETQKDAVSSRAETVECNPA